MIQYNGFLSTIPRKNNEECNRLHEYFTNRYRSPYPLQSMTATVSWRIHFCGTIGRLEQTAAAGRFAVL